MAAEARCANADEQTCGLLRSLPFDQGNLLRHADAEPFFGEALADDPENSVALELQSVLHPEKIE